MTRSLFLRGLALVYLIAFLSAAPQISGLIGEDGILPAGEYLRNIESAFGSKPYFSFPTLAWLNSSGTFLKAMAWSGAALAVALFIGVMPFASAAALYVLYLSIVLAGQTFFSFQWDALLLETGFAALLVTPFGFRPDYSKPTSPVGIWVLRLLIFRLMLESGMVKWLSGDPTWRQLTALNFHFETQPLPAPAAWYAHHLPEAVLQLSVLAVFAVELAVPFLFFMPRRLRRTGAWITIAFQLLIAATGNYTFFNLLTTVLCIPLFDDRPLRGGAPIRWPWLSIPVAATIAILGLLQLAGMAGLVRTLPEPVASINGRAQIFHVVNRYGLFAVMTTSRPEIVVEGSNDGVNWQEYEFKYKPGAVDRRLPWVAPHQPRLDWQMWFAALSNQQNSPWFSSFILRVLEGSPDVISLLAANPFPDQPPQYIRATLYDYRFTAVERRTTGAVWTRRRLGEYFPPVAL